MEPGQDARCRLWRLGGRGDIAVACISRRPGRPGQPRPSPARINTPDGGRRADAAPAAPM